VVVSAQAMLEYWAGVLDTGKPDFRISMKVLNLLKSEVAIEL